MNTIRERIHTIREDMAAAAIDAGRTPQDVHLIAVSKKKPVTDIEEAYAAGQRHFGENYIQEAMEKIDRISHSDITWHFIGHLQRNKARFAVKYFDVVHTVDSMKLAEEINKQAEKIGKVQDILIQIKIGDENSKSGATPETAHALIREIGALPHVRIAGLMTIPPPAETKEMARGFFRAMAELKSGLLRNGVAEENLQCMSMGMTDDFREAISEGATHVRIGTAIFGARA